MNKHVFLLFFLFSLLKFSVLELKSQALLKDEKDRASAALILKQPQNDSRISNRQHQRVSSIACTANGKEIYIAWYSGGKKEERGNYVTLSVSLDAGVTWKHDQIVVFPKKPSTRFYDPVLWRDKYDQIWLFYNTSMNNEKMDAKQGVNCLPISWDGNKVTCGESTLLSYGIIMCKPVYVEQKQMVLFPIYVKMVKDRFDRPDYVQDGTFIYKHDYQTSGKSLVKLDPYASIPVLPDSFRLFDEPSLVQLNNPQEFFCLIRYKRGMYYSRSYDYAKTWSALKPFDHVGPVSSSRCYIGRLASGNLILVVNNHKERKDMTVFLSKDDGKTWPHKLVVDEREKVSYPDIDQSSDGVIHLTYDRDRSKAQEINYCRFTEADIISGNINNIFKKRIN